MSDKDILSLFDLSKIEGLDFKQIDKNELINGLEIEGEHSKNALVKLLITLAHLREDPKYYTKLAEAGL